MPVSERTTLYLRGVPRAVVGEAKAAAARRGTTLAAFVTEAMARSVAPGGGAPAEDPFDADFAWYEAHRAQLAKEYDGMFVAILDREVIDHDRDFSGLAERVFRRAGVRPVLMPKVTREPRVVRVRSPRKSRA